jgi:2'-phosphotransferase
MSSNKQFEKISKFMSYVLRHHAAEYKLKLDKAGFVPVDDFLKVLQTNFNDNTIDMELLTKIVDTNDKKRFSFSDDKTQIRANQGHSTETAKNIDPYAIMTEIKEQDLATIKTAVHGTDYKSWLLIKDSGLKKMTRQFIHLAKGLPGEEGVISGMRKGCNVRIFVDLEKMLKDKIKVWESENGVILTAGVDGTLEPKYFKQVEIFKKGTWEKII